MKTGSKILLGIMFLMISWSAFGDFEEEENESEWKTPSYSPSSEIDDVEGNKDLDEKESSLETEEDANGYKEAENKAIVPGVKNQISDNKDVLPQRNQSNDPQKLSVEAPKKDKINKNKKLRKKPIKLKSDGLKGNKSTGHVQLKQNVKITQGDLEITCNEASIFFGKAKDEIEKVIASGKVKMKKIDEATSSRISASSRRMIYEHKKGVVTMKGNVTILRGSDVIKGKVLVYDINTGWISGKEVDGMLQPKSED